jgi:DNA-directed RNA polymerase specialized sigma24 family protein
MQFRRTRNETLLDDADQTLPEAEAATDESELQQILLSALLNVSEHSREVLSLHYLGGYSYAEIAELCHLPTNLVRSRLHEGRTQLKSQLLKVAADICHCTMHPDDMAKHVLDRCGTDRCQCASRLLDS